MTAQVIEKVHAAAHRLAREQLGDGREQGFFGRGVRVSPLGGRGDSQRLGLEACGRSCPTAGAAWWQRLKSALAPYRAAVFRPDRGAGPRARRLARARKSDQVVQAIVLPQQRRRGPNAGLLCQHDFDFAQLHAKAANLHLIVGAAQALHLAVFHARQVARAVQALVMLARGPGVGQGIFRPTGRAAPGSLRPRRGR